MNILYYMKNSTIIAVCSTLLTILISIPATYSFARFRFRYKEGVAYGFLFLQMVPGISIVFALFFIAGFAESVGYAYILDRSLSLVERALRHLDDARFC